jgi:hypothetical protein
MFSAWQARVQNASARCLIGVPALARIDARGENAGDVRHTGFAAVLGRVIAMAIAMEAVEEAAGGHTKQAALVGGAVVGGGCLL